MAIIDLNPPVGSPEGRAIFRWVFTDAANWVIVKFPENVAFVTIVPRGGIGYVSHTESGAFVDAATSNHKEIPQNSLKEIDLRGPTGLIRTLRLYHALGVAGHFEFEYLGAR